MLWEIGGILDSFLSLIFAIYVMIGVPVYIGLFLQILRKRDFGGAVLSIFYAGFVIGLWPAFIGMVVEREKQPPS